MCENFSFRKKIYPLYGIHYSKSHPVQFKPFPAHPLSILAELLMNERRAECLQPQAVTDVCHVPEGCELV